MSRTGAGASGGADAGIRAMRSGAIGSVLEFYDFFIYTQAAAIVFPDIFFPVSNSTLSIIYSLGTFGVGYIARPIGAFVLGALGDIIGRRKTLILTMTLMGISTFGVGLLPSYEQIGVAAPMLLVFFRLMQGFGVAGELSGSSTLIMEQTPIGLRGRRSSVTLQGAQAGQIFAALIFIPLSAFMSEHAFQTIGWRIPFILSALFVIFGFRVRLKTVESKKSTAVDIPPIRTVFRESPGALARVFVMALMNIIPVTATVFGASYATQEDYGIGWHPDAYLWIPVVGNVVAVLVIPHVASLSDKIGRRPVIIGGSLGAGVLSFVYLWAISIDSVPLTVAIAILMWGMLYQGYNAVFPAFYPEQFPTSTRVTGMAIAQNLGTTVSSLMSIVFVALVGPGTSYGKIIAVVGGLTLAITIMSAIATYLSPETSRMRSDQLGVRGAVPMDEEEYQSLRQENLAKVSTRLIG